MQFYVLPRDENRFFPVTDADLLIKSAAPFAGFKNLGPYRHSIGTDLFDCEQIDSDLLSDCAACRGQLDKRLILHNGKILNFPIVQDQPSALGWAGIDGKNFYCPVLRS